MSADVPIDELLQECERGVIELLVMIHGSQANGWTEPGDREVRQPPRVSDVGIDQPKARYSDRSRSEEHTSELQSRQYLVCRLLLEKQKQNSREYIHRQAHRAPTHATPVERRQ